MNYGAIIQRQRAFFQTGKTRQLEFRVAQLRKLADALVANQSAMLNALHADLRKPLQEAYLGEIAFVLSEVHHALRHLAAWMKPQRRSLPWIAWPGRGFAQPEPYGVVLIIGPWNYPLQLLFAPLVGAIAAGNCAVLKPSEFAPATSGAVAKLIRENFAEEYIAVVEGERDVAEALLQERFGKIFFTGSTVVGRAVMTAAAKHLTPVTLELGGKCPCIVCADAPLDVTARRIAWGKLMNAGQTCIAPDFVLVEHTVRDEFVNALKQAVHQFYGEDPQKSADYGRIVNRRHFDRLIGYLRHGCIVHGGQNDPDDLYIAPTILSETPLDSPVMQEEIFGPILPVIEFRDLDQALALLRNRPVPLAVYLFTNDRATQTRVLAETRSGGVCINDVVLHILSRHMPFGGLGESGMGSYHGKASFDCFTHYRSVLRRSFRVDVKLRYPPMRTPLATLERISRILLGG